MAGSPDGPRVYVPGAVMGVLNVTPDSFSDGGRFLDPEAAVAHGLRLIDEGAEIVDVGGESTRPGADPVGPDEEIRRVLPVVAGLADKVRVSIDTRHPEVARVAVAEGAEIINDISACLGSLAAELGVGWVAIHMLGDPRTMQDDPTYGDVVAEVSAFLVERAERAAEAGVAEVWIDPGIGFGKTTRHNLELLAGLEALVDTGWPVLVGASRKRFLGELAAASDGIDGLTPPDDRREGSVAVAAWAFHCGVRLVRAHDVRSTVQAAQVVG
ncbi:MAG: dihydropteroate synthase [Acidimicrobiales bacterium]|jgi:dihydropteroate synthase|nr:dihydropteroate synthase [Acidimicrobiales bacterium]MDP6650201.1 dihydropteroate synthase [Acidimicrobiales bacterium]MDP6758961.1 dihydropteroate synthase [Acidimicrobiales bacterium]